MENWFFEIGLRSAPRFSNTLAFFFYIQKNQRYKLQIQLLSHFTAFCVKIIKPHVSAMVLSPQSVEIHVLWHQHPSNWSFKRWKESGAKQLVNGESFLFLD